MRKLRSLLLILAVLIPFCLAGIFAAAVATLYLLGIGPYEKSWAAMALLMLLAPIGIIIGSMVGYGLLLSILRFASCEHWLVTEDTVPSTLSINRSNAPFIRLNAPFLWVQKVVYRLIPR
jgi:hypothetical protein